MTRAAFVSIGTAVPERVVTNADLVGLMDTTDEWIQQRTGIKERRWVKEGEGVAELAERAARQALEKAGWQPSDVEAIVFASIQGDHVFPGDGCYLQARLGIPGVPALDLRNACSGFLYGLSVASAWIQSGQYRRVLLVGAEVQSTGLDLSTRGRDIAVIFGDGAGAACLEATDDPGRGVLTVRLHADGRYTQELSGAAPGAIYHPRVSVKQIEEGLVYPRMEGQKVFKNAIVRMPEVVREALATQGLTTADIKLLVPHQANLRIAEMVQRSLELRDDQVFNNIQKYGNTTAASIPLCLAEGLEARGVARGDLVALCAFGAGFTWASALVRW
ncbi:MAG: ketoacyl-ACP synthase III [Anaeromyxobacter sp.]|nr:ketoacyl-ACP synthase III [Anaeromyxobacter sp.]MBL0278368.1 ketoacyl-ACP synthase III [Anaeromyxobacter sp.]